MRRSQERFGYLVAVAATLVVLLLRLALSHLLGSQAPLLPFLLAVMAAAWWGGLRSGLLATLLGALAGAFFFMEPVFSLWLSTAEEVLDVGMFLVVGTTISWLFEALYEAQLRETERQFHTLADLIPQLVWMAGTDGHQFWFNQRWYEYTGMRPNQIRSCGWQAFVDPAELARVSVSWNAAVAAGRPWEATFALRARDGQLRTHLARAVPVRDASGTTVCWFGTNTDIADRIEIERQLKEADSRKDQFLATLAHELRNPLAPISNALQLWPFVEQDTAEMDHLRTVMHRQLGQLIRLIDDLMDVSRISRGKIQLRRQQVDLRQLISETVEILRPALESAHHQLNLTLPAGPLWVLGDPTRLSQVLTNVLNNAVKYTGEQGVIDLTASQSADCVTIAIRDNGPGIPPELLGEIFEMFRQVDKTLQRSHGGLGIGLTLVKQLVELHGGTIEAHSEGSGKGSEFIIRLPDLAGAGDTAVDPPDLREGLSCADALARASWNDRAPASRRILIVDDLAESAETLARLLVSMGHQATAITDPALVEAWVETHHPDVVVLDIAMPGTDGYTLARRLRARQDMNDLILIALTGFGQELDRHRSFAAGFNFHLTKPAETATLAELLRHVPIRRSNSAVAAGHVD